MNQMNTPLVSVLMNCYNGERYLKEAIDSVMAQTYENWEIVFWDNQSKDNTANIVKGYDDSRIKYFYAPSFTDVGEARNLALAQARGDWIGFLDVDDEWLPEKLSTQISRYQSEPDRSRIGIIYSTMYHRNWSDKIDPPQVEEDRCGNLFRENLANFKIWIPTALVRRSAIEELKLSFNSQLNVVEDFDFFIRIAHKYLALQIKEPLAIYRTHADNFTFRNCDLWFKEHFYIMQKVQEDLGLDASYQPELEAFYKRFMAVMLDHLQEEILTRGNGAKHLKVFQYIERPNLKSKVLHGVAAGKIPVWAAKGLFAISRLYSSLKHPNRRVSSSAQP
jgi:glycosyltransferase involved in cell wall biosynthesis